MDNIINSISYLITGPFYRPDLNFGDRRDIVSTEDIGNESIFSQGEDENELVVSLKDRPAKRITYTISPEAHFLNIAGWIPVVSSISGLARILLGIVHTIIHLAKAFFEKENRKEHLMEAALGAYNIARGLIEVVPVIGNITVLAFDMIRMSQMKQTHVEYVWQSPDIA